MGWGGGRRCWSGISITHSGDGDPCGMRETLRLAGLVEDRELLLCWRKSGCVWSEYRVDTPNPGAGGGELTTEGFPSARGINLDKRWMGRPCPPCEGLDGGGGPEGRRMAEWSLQKEKLV